jgi:hypothetical protein
VGLVAAGPRSWREFGTVDESPATPGVGGGGGGGARDPKPGLGGGGLALSQ